MFFGGLLTGLYASAVGGGALVTFPLLILVGLPTHIAIATNRLSVVLLEFSSAIKFYKERKLDLGFGIRLGLVAAAGSYIGSNIVMQINERYLNIVVVFMLGILLVVFNNKGKLGIMEKKINRKNGLKVSFFTFLLGIYGGFFGGGFGRFIMFLLVMDGFTFIDGAATGRIIGFVMSLSAAIVFASNNLINYSYALALGSGCVIGSWVGVGIALKKGNDYVKTLFLIILVLTIVKLVSASFSLI